MRTDRIADRIVNTFGGQFAEIEFIPLKTGLKIVMSEHGKKEYWTEVLVEWADVEVLSNQLQELGARHGKANR